MICSDAYQDSVDQKLLEPGRCNKSLAPISVIVRWSCRHLRQENTRWLSGCNELRDWSQSIQYRPQVESSSTIFLSFPLPRELAVFREILEEGRTKIHQSSWGVGV